MYILWAIKVNTSWEEIAGWYDKIVGDKGHYFHKHVIFPKLLPLLALDRSEKPKLLDLGCGQGILRSVIPQKVNYTGVDASSSLIAKARERTKGSFYLHDVTKPFSLEEKDFTHATIILALQNMAEIAPVFENARRHLAPGGNLFIVLNHPCFRIPRQSSWGIDSTKKIQYRRLDRYLGSMAIPVQMHPSQKDASPSQTSFHHPLF